ncbi:hypothetical protein M422DRAFT_263938 [Sphaerobolus stellatus SS14]|uniref:Uncharacterized protein n=1 Tax=Sphaerobolus stellatus (strain SS14) TaxID=990650 RepID=A0A0C9TUF9_SPHS4|nr:hypothetical protein M422DRAFT_263938 [Sphaerobolus stellatus SS14]
MDSYDEAYSVALPTQTHSHCVAMFDIPEEEEESSPRPPNSYISTGSAQPERAISYTTARKDEAEDMSHRARGSSVDIVNNPYTVTPSFQAQASLLTIPYAPTSTHSTAPPGAIIASLEAPRTPHPDPIPPGSLSIFPSSPPAEPTHGITEIPVPEADYARYISAPSSAALAHQAVYWPLRPAGGYVRCGYPGCGESVGLVSAKDARAHLAGHLNGGKAYMCFWCVLYALCNPFVNEAEDG